MTQNLIYAIQGIWSHKMRSFLTMLGVIIGIASIIAIVSTIKGTNEQIMQNLIGAGNNAVTISLRQGEGDYYMDGGAPDGVTIVSEEQKEAIRSLPDAADASFYVKRTYVSGIESGENSMDMCSIYGVDLRYLSTCGYVVSAGRPFVEKDFQNYRKVVLIDEKIAQSLFMNENPLGRTVAVRGEPFTVIGVYKKADNFQPVINSYSDYLTYHQEEYGTFLIPIADWPIIYAYDEPEDCVVRAKTTEGMSTVGKDTEKIMNQSVTGGSDVRYKAEDLIEKARNKQELSASTNNLLIWVASIALLVGGIGVMNIMLVSVTERTAEIGLKKALGARKSVILMQFLTESAMLTSIGGILGVIAGIALAYIISRVTGAPTAISVPAIVLGVGFSMLIGIVFGLLPSIKAANLNPIEALRRE